MVLRCLCPTVCRWVITHEEQCCGGALSPSAPQRQHASPVSFTAPSASSFFYCWFFFHNLPPLCLGRGRWLHSWQGHLPWWGGRVWSTNEGVLWSALLLALGWAPPFVSRCDVLKPRWGGRAPLWRGEGGCVVLSTHVVVADELALWAQGCTFVIALVSYFGVQARGATPLSSWPSSSSFLSACGVFCVVSYLSASMYLQFLAGWLLC